MFFVSDTLLDQILADDIPYGDATSRLLGIENERGVIRCRPKSDMTIAGVALADRLFRRVGLETTRFCEEGDVVSAGTVILEARGTAGAIHAVYKTAQNILEYASGIATRTHQMLLEAQAGNPRCRVAVTRKHFPGTKTLSLYAAMAGGAVAHRMGLSESVLVFDQHRVFLPDFEQRLATAKKSDPERKIAVEVSDAGEGLAYAAAGADIIQCEKFPLEAFVEFVASVKREFPHLIVSAAGGVNASNARAYARAGADFLVTTWPYFGKPADIKMQILAAEKNA